MSTTPVPETPIASWRQGILIEDAMVLERQLSLLIQPKPRFLPERLWNRIVRRVVVLEERR